jgi:hypothetical protein
MNLPLWRLCNKRNAFYLSLTKTVKNAATSNLAYNYTSSEALALDIDPSLIANTVTAFKQPPRTGRVIGLTSNKL